MIMAQLKVGTSPMRKSLLSASALVGVALLANNAQAARATYIPLVPPPGAVSTTVFGINDSNVVAGSFNDSGGVEHGFFGPLDGSNYTVFDVGSDTTGTEPRAIGNDGSITGLAKASGFSFGEEFFRAPDGTTNIIQYGARIFDGVAQGINGKGVFVGDFLNREGVRTGYKGTDGRFLHRIKVPIDTIATNPRKMNNHGLVTGSYTDSSGVQHGFLKRHDSFQTFDYPDAVGVTVGEGLNDKGVVSGLWTDSSGNRHGFSYDSDTQEYTLIDGGGDGSFFQQVWGINNKGLIAVNTTSDGSTYISYIYCPHKAANCPQGGAKAREVEVHSIHAVAGMSSKTARHLPPAKVKNIGNTP